jgi:hypothetical protein
VLRNTYVNCHTLDGRAVPWQPPALPEGAQAEEIYFGRVLAEMDRRLDRGGLTVYATNDVESLPSYGRDVVVLLIGEEWTRVPAYHADVRAIFTNLAVRPELGANPLRDPSWVNLGLTLAYGRMWAYHFPGQARLRMRRARGGWTAPILRVPIGILDQLDLPIKPLAERRHDVFFAGSVGHRGGGAAWLLDRIRPKTVARDRMMRNAERLAERHPELSVALATTAGFLESLAADSAAYSHAMMDSRIGLVPRGATPDTCRFWQVLRYGCVPVVDALPVHSFFYDGAPVVALSDWDELEDAVMPLLADADRLQDLHERGLEWWRTRGAEAAVGAYMARRLNEIRD